MKRAPRIARRQRGLSLVELVVAAAVAMFVFAGAVQLMVSQVDGSRRLLVEARLQQDLRAAGDLVARDLRRAGYWQGAVRALQPPLRLNPYAATTPAAEAVSSTALYSYSRDPVENDIVDANERFGLRLQGGVLQALDANGWQQLTDPGTVRITQFRIVPQLQSLPLGQLCEPGCDADDPDCPRLVMRRYEIVISGHSTRDMRMRRELRESVRLRNDEWPVGACPAAAAP